MNAMSSWYRPDPLTRDLIHLINARRHEHGDPSLAIEVLQALLDQDREHEVLTVLAALDESMAEWLFDLLAEASSSSLMDTEDEENEAYGILASFEARWRRALTELVQLATWPQRAFLKALVMVSLTCSALVPPCALSFWMTS